MTSGQATTVASSASIVKPPHANQYDWSNIATIRRSINRNRSSAGDRYPKYGDPIVRSSGVAGVGSSSSSSSRPGSIDLGLYSNGNLYPHLEHPYQTPPPSPSQNVFNLRSSKSEYYLPTPQQTSSFYQRPTDNIDDDTKWIASSASTASYHSNDEIDDDRSFGGVIGDHRQQSPVYAEISVKPVSIGQLPPLDRGLPYRNYSRFVGGNYNGSVVGGDAGSVQPPPPSSSSSLNRQTSVVGDNLPNGGVRKAQTPPPPSMLLSPPTPSHMNQITNGGQNPPRKYFTLNPRNRPNNDHQRIDRQYFHTNGGGVALNEDRRRSMTPTTATIGEAVVPSQYSSQALLNRSQSCYVDPLDFKVGCQNTLRSKPLIPWYELAIKDNNRRSCPQFEVDKGSCCGWDLSDSPLSNLNLFNRIELI